MTAWCTWSSHWNWCPWWLQGLGLTTNPQRELAWHWKLQQWAFASQDVFLVALPLPICSTCPLVTRCHVSTAIPNILICSTTSLSGKEISRASDVAIYDTTCHVENKLRIQHIRSSELEVCQEIWCFQTKTNNHTGLTEMGSRVIQILQRWDRIEWW